MIDLINKLYKYCRLLENSFHLLNENFYQVGEAGVIQYGFLLRTNKESRQISGYC